MDKFTQATINTYNQTAEEYAKNVALLHHSEVATAFLTNLPEDNINILDLGCGSGRDAKIFSEEGYRVTGVDLSARMIQVASAAAPFAKFKQMDMRKLEFNNETFGGIWAVASLLHLPKKDLTQCLHECNRVLKKEGLLYVGVKVGKGEQFEPDTRYGKDAYKFYSYFAPGEMDDFLAHAGFDIIDSSTKQCFKDYLKHDEIRVLGIKSQIYTLGKITKKKTSHK